MFFTCIDESQVDHINCTDDEKVLKTPGRFFALCKNKDERSDDFMRYREDEEYSED